MKKSTKIVLGAATLFALLLGALVLVPVIFRGKIEERVKVGVNDAIAAEADWTRVRLSLLRDFPNLTLGLDDLTVTGIGAFEGDTLASVGRFAAVVDLGTAYRAIRFGEPMVVRSIEIDRPILRLTVLEDGTANWGIARESDDDPADESAAGVDVTLRSLRIRDAALTLDDRQSGLQASVTGYNQSLTGDFARDAFVLATQASADEVSLRFAGVPYLNRVRLALEAEIDADMANSRFTFRDNQLRLNELALAFAGSVGVGEEELDLDVTFAAPSTDFRHILSLVPAIYAREFQSLETTGTMTVSGQMRGKYREGTLPAFALKTNVQNGTFKYPDLPLPAREIFLDLAIENPGGDADRTVVDLSRFHVVIGNEPIDGAMVLRTPVSDPDVDLRLRGRLDLAEFERTVKLDAVDDLAGVLIADLAMRTRQSYVDAGQFDRITASGGAEIRGVSIRAEDLPHDIAIDEAVLRFNPRHAELSSFRGRIGSSDLQLVGQLENLIGFAFRDEVLRGQANFRSAHFDLDEWQSDSEGLEVVPVPAGIDFVLDAEVARLTYDKLDMRNVRGRVRVKDQRIDLENLAMNVLGGEVAVTGFYETTDVTRPTFDANLRVRTVEIPTAFATLATVEALAPVARFAQGNFSAEIGVRGALGADMMPVFDLLNGQGSLETSSLTLHGFPAMASLAEALRIEPLRNPSLEGFRSFFEIRDGRLHVRPFDVNLGPYRMNVAGSNGIDQSLQYALRLHVPRSVLGSEANQAIARLVAQSGRAGIDLEAAEVIELGAQLDGTVMSPTLRLELGEAVGSARQIAERAVRDEIDQRVESVERRLDETVAEGRRMSQAEADRILGEAEQRAATIMAEANTLAENVRREGYEQADALLDRAGTPVARLAARPAADRLRKESDDRAAQILREADGRADAILAEARRRTGTEDAPED